MHRGRKFDFHGKFKSKAAAKHKEAQTDGGFIVELHGYYYVLSGDDDEATYSRNVEEIMRSSREERSHRYSSEIEELRDSLRQETDEGKKRKLRSLLAKYGGKRFYSGSRERNV